MATVYGVDLSEIRTNNLIKDEHIETIYGVLSGDPNYSDPEHVIDFTGTLMAGSNNDEANNVDFGFAFGENNRVGADSSLVIGKDGESYATGQFVLSGGKINKRGDSQKYEALRSFTTSSGGSTSEEIPTRDNSISSLKVRLTGAEVGVFSGNTLVSAEYDLVFVNSRSDPDSSERVGKILFIERNWASGNFITQSGNKIEVNFNVTANHFLEIEILDNRGTGNDLNWSVHIDAVETYAGKDITDFGPAGYGYGTGYVTYGGQSGYENPIQGCFPPGSEVLIKNQNEPIFGKPIEDVQEGDSLLAFQPKNGTFESYKQFKGRRSGIQEFIETQSIVTNIFYGFKESVLRINNNFLISKSQPIFVFDPSENFTKFLRAEELKEGMKLVNNKKNFVTINSIQEVKKDQEVISLDVEEVDVFFVEGMLVHNKH